LLPLFTLTCERDTQPVDICGVAKIEGVGSVPTPSKSPSKKPRFSIYPKTGISELLLVLQQLLLSAMAP